MSHFTMTEFTRSSTAARLGIDNTLPVSLVQAAQETLDMMERIRGYLSGLAGRDVPITITSGYRCPQLNAAIGSAATSDHPKAAAADWRADSFGTPVDICRVLAAQVGALGIGQLINEFPGPNGWVHTSTRMPMKALNRIITITHNGTFQGVLAA